MPIVTPTIQQPPAPVKPHLAHYMPGFRQWTVLTPTGEYLPGDSGPGDIWLTPSRDEATTKAKEMTDASRQA